ncbi:MAG: AEC family transporter [Candidatus Fimivivens sp.]
MENFIFCLNAVVPGFLLIASGYFVRKVGWLDAVGTKQINRLCFYLLLPLLMFKTAYTSNFSTAFDPVLLILCVLCLVSMIGAMLLIAPKLTHSRGRIGVMAQASFRSNAVMLGLPFAISLSDGEAAGTMGVLVACTVPLYNILAVVIFSIYTDTPTQKIDIKSVLVNVLSNPLIVASVAGFALSGLRISLPILLQRPIFDLGTAGSVIAMVGVGAQLDFKNALRNMKLTLVCACAKLLILPLVGTTIAILIGMKGVALCSLFLILATPNATGSPVMADVMGADGALAAEMVVFTTGASIVTVFIGALVLKNMGLI